MITFIFGSMFSGKTSHLLFKYKKSKEIQKYSCCMICPLIINRLKTHDGNYLDDYIIYVEKLEHIYLEADNIFIDEAQFFDDIYDFCLKYRFTKNIIISGLIADFNGNAFNDQIAKTFCIANKRIELFAVCNNCKKDEACKTNRINKDEKGLIVLDDGKNYEPLCEECFIILNNLS